MKLIAYAGKAGCGKSTCATHLVRDHGYERLSFAAPLYDMLEAGGFGRPRNQEEKEAIIPWLGKSWREAAQTLGTEWGRALIDPNLWVKLALRRMFVTGNYVIEDLRFENEAKAVRDVGGLIVHLKGREHPMTEGTSQHASEAGIAWASGDIMYNNTGTEKDLTGFVDELAHMVQFRR